MLKIFYRAQRRINLIKLHFLVVFFCCCISSTPIVYILLIVSCFCILYWNTFCNPKVGLLSYFKMVQKRKGGHFKMSYIKENPLYCLITWTGSVHERQCTPQVIKNRHFRDNSWFLEFSMNKLRLFL